MVNAMVVLLPTLFRGFTGYILLFCVVRNNNTCGTRPLGEYEFFVLRAGVAAVGERCPRDF